ncbi:MAG: lysozyme [Duncaniella sp.]|nr:lysozyme [Duncaniella sp.]
MTPSKEIRAKMMQWEGCRLTAYRCPAGVLTIGYGHTGPDVTEGLKISAVKAVELFNADLDRFSASVSRLLTRIQLSQCQFDALVSIAYNIGTGNFSRSGLLARVKADPTDPAIRTEFLKHVKARVGGVLKTLPGLVSRRTSEADHYFARK